MLFILHFFFQHFISLLSLYKMNLSPARKRTNGVLSKLEREEQEVFMFTVCGPQIQNTHNVLQKAKKKMRKVLRIQSPSFSGAGYCARV